MIGGAAASRIQVYGVTRENGSPIIINVGIIQPRGEKNVLNVPSSLSLRLRYNPFFSYLEERVVESATRLFRGDPR